MKVNSFKRGINMDSRKHATEGKAMEYVPKLKQVVIPVNQHFGAPNKVLVKVGDNVKRGQRIAEGMAPGPMTVPVHASICGKVKKIENITLSNNADGLCVIIEADGEEDEMFMPPLDPFTCSKEESLQRIRDAGIVGMGGAGFPTHVKLSPPPNKTIDTIIVNFSECECYLTNDEAIMSLNLESFFKGLAIVMKLLGVDKGIIGLGTNKLRLVPMLEDEIKRGNYPGDIQIGICGVLYPQGGEKMLIKTLIDREVPSGGLPMDIGCLVINVSTLVAITEAFTLGKPLIDRNLTVSGAACKTPKNIMAPIGSSLADFLDGFMEVDFQQLKKIVFGGPMMGVAVPSLDVPIQKNTSGILLLTEEELVFGEESPCIRCCRCLHYCAMFLSPTMMNSALEADDFDDAVNFGLLDCMECGACTYMCPARIKLTQRFKVGKQRLRNLQASKVKPKED